jgi:RIO kinase 1
LEKPPNKMCLCTRMYLIMMILLFTGKSNPRKMVKVWAEKEMRNYRRIHSAGIPTPEPIFLKSHVLLMEFLGNNGWPSPRLKDANLSERHMREAYVQTILIMRHMYQRCNLVHGDFSEYNLLWHNNQVYVIDVSQSVETDHPAALDFLRKDASNVNDFFGKVGKLDVMNTRQLFDFITAVIEDNEDAEMEYVDKAIKDVHESQKILANRSEQERRKNEQQDAVDEAVFMSSFLPRSLNQVADYDVRQIEKGEVEAIYAHAVAALTGNQEAVEKYHAYQRGESVAGGRVEGDTVDERVDPADDGDVDSSSEEDESDSEEENDDDLFVRAVRTPEELEVERASIKALRKANKKAVREEKTEKRQTKIKKKDKKRAIKKAKAGNRKIK